MRFLFSAALWIGLGISVPLTAWAEDQCSGPTYVFSDCRETAGGSPQCAQEKCQDVSFNQDASLFQCCPPSNIPELPEWVNPFYLALFISLGFLAYQRRRERTAPDTAKSISRS